MFGGISEVLQMGDGTVVDLAERTALMIPNSFTIRRVVSW